MTWKPGKHQNFPIVWSSASDFLWVFHPDYTPLFRFSCYICMHSFLTASTQVLQLLQHPLLSLWQIKSKDLCHSLNNFNLLPYFISLHGLLFFLAEDQAGFLMSGLFSSYAYVLHLLPFWTKCSGTIYVDLLCPTPLSKLLCMGLEDLVQFV